MAVWTRGHILFLLSPPDSPPPPCLPYAGTDAPRRFSDLSLQVGQRGSHTPALSKDLFYCRSTCLSGTEPSDSKTSFLQISSLSWGSTNCLWGTWAPGLWPGVGSCTPYPPSHPIPKPQGKLLVLGGLSVSLIPLGEGKQLTPSLGKMRYKHLTWVTASSPLSALLSPFLEGEHEGAGEAPSRADSV